MGNNMVYISKDFDCTKDVREVLEFINKISDKVNQNKQKISKAISYNDFVAFQFDVLFTKHF